MGSVYRRRVRVCTTCDQRLDTTAAWRTCAAAGHRIVIRAQPIWWVRSTVGGRSQCVSSHSTKKDDATQLLWAREHGGDTGAPIPAPVSPVTFDDAAADLLTDYVTNRRRSHRVVALRVTKHLTPFFGARRLGTITTADVRAYTAQRQAAGAANATINRDLMLLKRMCTLAVQAGTLPIRPYIPLLQERNIRQGFFEPDQSARIQQHLPDHLRPIAAFATITGWRTPSEILPLEWRHVDMTAGEVRLDAGTTKNGDGRVFPFTTALRRVLEDQQQVAATRPARDGIASYVFTFRTGPKAGQRISEAAFNKAWRIARVAAGCPDRIPHDFRRTAVRNLVRAGVPERVAMQLTGHKTRAVFERYNIVSHGDLRDAAQRLDTYASTSG